MNQTAKPRESNLHQCEYCQKQFSKISNLNVHRKIHLYEKDLKCSFCDYVTNHKDCLNTHIRTHTNERPYKCGHPDCSANFARSSHLAHHQRLHSKDSENMLKCPSCPYETVYKSSLNQHLKNHLDVKEFSCDLCPFQTNHKHHVKRHHENVHLNLKRFKCEEPNCDFACNYKPQLNHHQLVHTDNDEEKEKLLTFKCDQCPYKTTNKGTLKTHLLRTHSTLKEFSCDLCPFRTKHAGSVKAHRKLVHLQPQLRPFKCPEQNCNYAAKTRSDFGRHMNRHGNVKQFACSFPNCNYKTDRKMHLKTHEMMHRGEKPHKCTLCTFTTTHPSSLRSHIRGHTGEAPYPCPNCPYRGKRLYYLTLHLKRCKLGKDQANGSVKEGGTNQQEPLE